MEISEDGLVGLIKDVINSVQNQYDKVNADNYILRSKNAEVLWYQPMTLIACVRFLEDKNKNEYHLRNHSHAFLAPGDQVHVYYHTNAAKGWIEDRCGAPNFMNEYGQYTNDLRNCCDDEENGGNCCCESSCCSEAAVQQKDKETVTVEEWTERIEGNEVEIHKYEENESKNSPLQI